MIDITVDDKENKIEVDMAVYHFRNQADMIVLLSQLIYKIKFSGETISIYRAEGDMKRLIEVYH